MNRFWCPLFADWLERNNMNCFFRYAYSYTPVRLRRTSIAVNMWARIPLSLLGSKPTTKSENKFYMQHLKSLEFLSQKMWAIKFYHKYSHMCVKIRSECAFEDEYWVIRRHRNECKFYLIILWVQKSFLPVFLWVWRDFRTHGMIRYIFTFVSVSNFNFWTNRNLRLSPRADARKRAIVQMDKIYWS